MAIKVTNLTVPLRDDTNSELRRTAVELWNTINRWCSSCGGDPDTNFAIVRSHEVSEAIVKFASAFATEKAIVDATNRKETKWRA